MSEWGDERREKVGLRGVPSRGCMYEEGGVVYIDIDTALVTYSKSSPTL